MGLNMKFNKKVIFIGIMIVVIVIFIFLSLRPDLEIKDFDNKRDRSFIKEAFAKDKYWLVAEPELFSEDFMMDTMSPNKNPEYFGKLYIKVLLKEGKPAGFTTYYKKKFYDAQIQFVYVHEEHRGKGYAEKLVKYALDQFKKMNVKIAKIVARKTNYKAITVYKRVDFREVSHEDGFVYFEKQLD